MRQQGNRNLTTLYGIRLVVNVNKQASPPPAWRARWPCGAPGCVRRPSHAAASHPGPTPSCRGSRGGWCSATSWPRQVSGAGRGGEGVPGLNGLPNDPVYTIQRPRLLLSRLQVPDTPDIRPVGSHVRLSCLFFLFTLLKNSKTTGRVSASVLQGGKLSCEHLCEECVIKGFRLLLWLVIRPARSHIGLSCLFFLFTVQRTCRTTARVILQ